ncbi:MAG TPA: hypothetical protein VIV34_02595 [Pseudolabrys sp.]
MTKTARKTADKPSPPRTTKATLARRFVFTPELVAYARHRFEHTDDSLADIALDLDVHKDTVRAMSKRERWTKYVRPPRDLPPAVRLLMEAEALDSHPEAQAKGQSKGQGHSVAVSARTDSEGDIPPLADIVARLHRVVLDELAAIETLHAQSKHEPRGADSAARTARTLSSLTETLQRLQRLQLNHASTGPDDDPLPANIDEFRNELARRIRVFIESRQGVADAVEDAAVPVDAVR